MSDYVKRVERATDALVTGIISPFYYVTAVLIYGWTGWLGVVGLCIGSLLYGVGSVAWYARRRTTA